MGSAELIYFRNIKTKIPGKFFFKQQLDGCGRVLYFSFSFIFFFMITFRCNICESLIPVVLFASPDKEKWVPDTKEGFIGYVFGMELWTEEELKDAKAKIGTVDERFLTIPETLVAKNYPRQLQLELKTTLDRLGFATFASELKRTNLFGMQARTYFGDIEIINRALDRLRQIISKLDEDIVQVFSVLSNRHSKRCSHQLLNLCYNPKIRFFYPRFASLMLGKFAMNILSKRTLRKNFGVLENVHKDDHVSCRSSCERLVPVVLMTGGKKFDWRNHGEDITTCIEFPKCVFEQFTYEIRNNVRIFLDIAGRPYMLRTTLMQPIVLECQKEDLSTIDQIVITPPPTNNAPPMVDFFQCTTAGKHTVSPASFFSMILLVSSVRRIYGVEPHVRFIFAVPHDKYANFNSLEVNNLFNVCSTMEVKVVDISYDSTGLSDPGITSSDDSTGLSDPGITPSDDSNEPASEIPYLLESDELGCFSRYSSEARGMTSYALCNFFPISEVDWGVVKFTLSEYFVGKVGDEGALPLFTRPEYAGEFTQAERSDELDRFSPDENASTEPTKGEFADYYSGLEKVREYFYPRLLRRVKGSHFLVVRPVYPLSHLEVFGLIAHLLLRVSDVLINDSTSDIGLVFKTRKDVSAAKKIIETLREVFTILDNQ
jgi:hypothetical protein